MSRAINIAEECHVVNLIPPIDINGAGASSEVFNMKNHAHASIIVQLGVTGAATTLTVEECDNITPTTDTPIVFNYYAEATAAGDTLGAKTAATVAGIALGTGDSIMYVVELDASQLTADYPYVQIELSDPSAATLASAVAILSGSRYAVESSATAIT
ncbi:MAG: hypothetical protein ABIH03_12085 [Pseudomonadota bacterium]